VSGRRDHVKLTIRISPQAWHKLLREYAWRGRDHWVTFAEVFEDMIAALPERDITDAEARQWSERW